MRGNPCRCSLQVSTSHTSLVPGNEEANLTHTHNECTMMFILVRVCHVMSLQCPISYYQYGPIDVYTLVYMSPE